MHERILGGAAVAQPHIKNREEKDSHAMQLRTLSAKAHLNEELLRHTARLQEAQPTLFDALVLMPRTLAAARGSTYLV